MKESALSKLFLAEAQKAGYDAFRMETSLDDGLPDIHLTDKTGGKREFFIELKIGKIANDDLILGSLQIIQTKFLAKRNSISSGRAWIVAWADGDYYLVYVDPLDTPSTYSRLSLSGDERIVCISMSIADILGSLRLK